jgi:hypothetical protein
LRLWRRGSGLKKCLFVSYYLFISVCCFRNRGADFWAASRLCLDLLNEELEQRLEADEQSKLHH